MDRNRPDGGGEGLPIGCNGRPWGVVGDRPSKLPGVRHVADGLGGPCGSDRCRGTATIPPVPEGIVIRSTDEQTASDGLKLVKTAPEGTFPAGSDLCGSAASQQGILWTRSRGICVA